MKTQPILPARIDFSDPAAPLAPDFGDVYHSRAGALAQARHVFLGANALPGRWAGRARFVILETGFGLGNNFLATWEAWQHDEARCEQLIFISIEKHPLRRDDLRQAHAGSELRELADQLLDAWPPLTPNLHRLRFAQGRVLLLLCLGDAQAWLRELLAEVDAFYLDGFNPSQNPAMWDRHLLKALARHAAPDATAGSWSVAPAVREGLAAAGFTVERQRGFANKGGMCVARYRPQHNAAKPAGRLPLAPGAREALVIGAGLAGAACAWALRGVGVRSAVIDAADAVAQGSSGNPAGLFHGTLNPDDGLHARFNRAAALETARTLKALPPLPWRQAGLLRLETGRSLADMRALLQRQGLPDDYVQALDAGEAGQRAGLDLSHPAWFYPQGGALAPGDYVRALLADADAELRLGRAVAGLRRHQGLWQALAADGRLLGEAPLLVLAGGHQALALLQALNPSLCDGLGLRVQRGQITELRPARPRPLLPVAGLGYAIALGEDGLLCGATSQDGDPEPQPRALDHQRNLAQWRELAGLDSADAEPLRAHAGRVGWRLAAPDRLPLVGGLPDGSVPARADQTRFQARLPGLAVCTGLGSRGITWAALCAQLVAAQVSGAPCPLEASLVDAVDPARFAVRRARAGA